MDNISLSQVCRSRDKRKEPVTDLRLSHLDEDVETTRLSLIRPTLDMMSEKESEEVKKLVSGRLSTAGFQVLCERKLGDGVEEVFKFTPSRLSDFGDSVVGELVINQKKLSEVYELRDGLEKAQKLLVALIKDSHKSLEDARSSVSVMISGFKEELNTLKRRFTSFDGQMEQQQQQPHTSDQLQPKLQTSQLQPKPQTSQLQPIPQMAQQLQQPQMTQQLQPPNKPQVPFTQQQSPKTQKMLCHLLSQEDRK